MAEWKGGGGVDEAELRATIALGIFRRVQAGEPLTPPDDPVRRRIFDEEMAARAFRANYRANREKKLKGQ